MTTATLTALAAHNRWSDEMSSFTIQARNKETGDLCEVDCIDDYFGRHQYGYIVNGGRAIQWETFDRMYEEVKS